MRTRFAVLGVSLLVAAGLHPSGAQAQVQAAAARPLDDVASDSGRSRGSAKAPITVYALSDFQCPSCREFQATRYPRLAKRFIDSGFVRLVFLNNPLEQHAHARFIAEVAMCTIPQGNFWMVHDAIFQYQPQLDRIDDIDSGMMRLLQAIGADSARAKACVRSGEGRRRVDADISRWTSWGIGAVGTPTFVINGKVVARGVDALTALTAALDSILGR
jgi:protein-disulfide isomerase